MRDKFVGILCYQVDDAMVAGNLQSKLLKSAMADIKKALQMAFLGTLRIRDVVAAEFDNITAKSLLSTQFTREPFN